jgi:hypothetical protein
MRPCAPLTQKTATVSLLQQHVGIARRAPIFRVTNVAGAMSFG